MSSLERPGNEFEFNVAATYRRGVGLKTASGGVTVPLGEQLSVRLAAQSSPSADGSRTRRLAAIARKWNATPGVSASAWEPSSGFDATLVYEAQEYEGQGMPAEAISATPEAFGLSALAGFPGFETNFDRVSASTDSRVNDAFFEDSSVDRASLTAHWRVGEFLVTSQTAWSQSDSDARAGHGIPSGGLFLSGHGPQRRRFQPGVRLTSPAEQRFRYVAGRLLRHERFEQANAFFANYPGAPPSDGRHRDRLRSVDGFMVAVRPGGLRS